MLPFLQATSRTGAVKALKSMSEGMSGVPVLPVVTKGAELLADGSGAVHGVAIQVQ